MIKSFLTSIYQNIASYFRAKWDALQPFLQKVKQTLLAIWTATTTFKFAIQIMPIVLSILTVLTTIPLLDSILPSFFLNTHILLGMMFLICIFAGWCKYTELRTRASLDEQILENKQEIKNLRAEINKLKATLAHNKPPPGVETHFDASFIPLKHSKTSSSVSNDEKFISTNGSVKHSM